MSISEPGDNVDKVQAGGRSRRVPTTDGVDIAVHDLGGTGPPLVFAHATGFHGLVWRPVGIRLADGFRCVSLDERGHGDSGRPLDLNFDWRGFGRDILAVVDGLGLDGPLGVGHSSGGTAMLLAEQSRPGTFGAIYCFEPVVVPADPPLGRDASNWLAAAARRRRDVFDSREQAHASYASKPPFSAWLPEVLAVYVDHGFVDRPDGTVQLKCRPEDEARVYEMATAHDGYAHLAEVRCPVLVAYGTQSDAVGGAEIEALGGLLPDARTEVLGGLGHLGPMEDPAAVADSIRRFAQGLVR